jgi:hypothetical protein
MRFFQYLTLSLCALAAATQERAPDPFEVIRQRERALQWPAQQYLPGIITRANASLRTLNSSCLWPDIDYYDQSRAIWKAMDHLTRVTALVQATTTPGSPAFEDAALMAGLHCALLAWLTRTPRWSSQNWWWS